MPPATTYSPAPPPQSHTPYPQATTPNAHQYPQQPPAAKRPKLTSPYPTRSASPSPISPHGSYFSAIPAPPITYNMSSAPTSMLPPPPPSQQPLGGGGGGGGGGSQPPKATDTNELADALASAGIDLKEEEAHLSMPINNSFQGLNPVESMNIRRDAESRANHALNPFINTRVLQNKIRTKAREHNMNLGIAVQQGIGSVSQDVTTFLSLAMRERLHGLVTRSIVLARQRRAGTGMISGEWGAFVKGGDKHQSTVNVDGGASGSPLTHNSLKRSFSSFSTPHTQTQTTTSIANETARALRFLAQQELQAETERVQQKAQKSTTSTSNNNGTGPTSDINPGASPVPEFSNLPLGSNPPTPGAELMAPEPPKKLSAKETKKNQDIRVQEAVAHRAANSTAAMMMGLGGAFGGKKKKKYAWMMAGNPAGGAGAPGAPGSGAGGSKGGPGGSGGAGDASAGGVREALSVWGKRIGEWREDGEKGLGVQIRDWAGALEGDGRERRAVVRAYLKMK